MKRKRKEKPQHCQGGADRTLPWQDVKEDKKRDKKMAIDNIQGGGD